MKLLLTALCYELDSLTGKTIVEIMRGGLGFEPTRLRTDKFLKSSGKLTDRWLKKLAGTDELQTLEIQSSLGPGGPSLQYTRFLDWGFQGLFLRTPYDSAPDLARMLKLTSIKGFTFAACADSDDVQWQSETFISNYETSGRSYAGMAKVYDPTWERDMIDIKQNPGRISLFVGMWLQSGWRMWFGQPSFKYMPPRRLLSFPQAQIAEQLKSKVIFLQLYPDADAFAERDNRARQAAFRKWMGMDIYEDHATDFLASSGKSDPPHEMKSGKFPHGGVWHYMEWLDQHGNLTRRSKAVKKRESEYDENLKRVWQGDVTACR